MFAVKEPMSAPGPAVTIRAGLIEIGSPANHGPDRVLALALAGEPSSADPGSSPVRCDRRLGVSARHPVGA
jgi:hypothetical protein